MARRPGKARYQRRRAAARHVKEEDERICPLSLLLLCPCVASPLLATVHLRSRLGSKARHIIAMLHEMARHDEARKARQTGRRAEGTG